MYKQRINNVSIMYITFILLHLFLGFWVFAKKFGVFKKKIWGFWKKIWGFWKKFGVL